MTGAVPLSRVDLDDVPTHIAAIMDGNGRWATGQGLARTKGHEAGEDATFEAVEGCLAAGVKWFTVYAFSTENWRRPKAEVQFLINFNRELLRRRRDELHDRDVRIRFIGRRNWRVPRGLLKDWMHQNQWIVVPRWQRSRTSIKVRDDGTESGISAGRGIGRGERDRRQGREHPLREIQDCLGM